MHDVLGNLERPIRFDGSEQKVLLQLTFQTNRSVLLFHVTLRPNQYDTGRHEQYRHAIKILCVIAIEQYCEEFGLV